MSDVKKEYSSAFHDRYATDPEFKRQVDDGRKRSGVKRDHERLKTAMTLIRGKRDLKHY